MPFTNRLYTLSQSNIPEHGVAGLKFSEYAKNNIKNEVEQWQKKKEYETTVQWRDRVTEETRKVKVAELLDKYPKEYIENFSPSVLIGNIGMYDADYNIFPIDVNGLNTIYVSVPLDEAENFKNNWHYVTAKPVYGIVDDKLGVLTCSFTLKNKTYQSADTYENDNTSDFALNLSPLEFDFAENTGLSKVDTKPAIKIDNSIDLNIPTSSVKNTKTFVVIIGNENYQHTSKVQFAHNDAVIFGKYCNQTLGVPIKNLRRYKDATYGSMLSGAKRGDGMLLSARGTAIKPKDLTVSGNTIVFSAASGEQTAFS